MGYSTSEDTTNPRSPKDEVANYIRSCIKDTKKASKVMSKIIRYEIDSDSRGTLDGELPGYNDLRTRILANMQGNEDEGLYQYWSCLVGLCLEVETELPDMDKMLKVIKEFSCFAHQANDKPPRQTSDDPSSTPPYSALIKGYLGQKAPYLLTLPAPLFNSELNTPAGQFTMFMLCTGRLFIKLTAVDFLSAAPIQQLSRALKHNHRLSVTINFSTGMLSEAVSTEVVGLFRTYPARMVLDVEETALNITAPQVAELVKLISLATKNENGTPNPITISISPYWIYFDLETFRDEFYKPLLTQLKAQANMCIVLEIKGLSESTRRQDRTKDYLQERIGFHQDQIEFLDGDRIQIKPVVQKQPKPAQDTAASAATSGMFAPGNAGSSAVSRSDRKNRSREPSSSSSGCILF